jgi:dTDP-4-amino-4,6-dideoxygalactose transaminase
MNVATPLHCANPGAEFQEDRDDLLSIMASTLDRGTYILGEEVRNFEREFAAYIGGAECVAVANGTDAISYALRGLGIQPGDEVITVSHTAVATVAAIEQVGAIPVFADIDLETRCMCPQSLEMVMSDKTRAVIVVHIYGQPAPIGDIVSLAHARGVAVLEDCAQAHGAMWNGRKVGTIGDVSAFSFYPTKNLGALGDGGAIVIRADREVGDRIRKLRQYGWKERYISQIAGGNSRLDELQAAILRYRLRKLDARNTRRQQIAKFYSETLIGSPIEPPAIIPGTTHVMHQYVVTTDRRDQLKEHLCARGVMAALHYPQAIHQQPAYAGRIRGGDALPNTEAFYRQLLSLPIYPQLKTEEIEHVSQSLRSFWS